jgi:hypothetical protein
MLSSANVMGNGMQVGSTPVDMNLQMKNTYNPFYSGSGALTIFAESERRLALVVSGVVLQTASFLINSNHYKLSLIMINKNIAIEYNEY